MELINEKLSAKKIRAIAALLECQTIKEAAQAVGIGETTLFRWLQDESFKQTYRQARREAVQQAIAHLQQICSQAVQALRAIMADPNAAPSSRVMAARTILEQSIKAIEIEDLELRITRLEEKF